MSGGYGSPDAVYPVSENVEKRQRGLDETLSWKMEVVVKLRDVCSMDTSEFFIQARVERD